MKCMEAENKRREQRVHEQHKNHIFNIVGHIFQSKAHHIPEKCC